MPPPPRLPSKDREAPRQREADKLRPRERERDSAYDTDRRKDSRDRERERDRDRSVMLCTLLTIGLKFTCHGLCHRRCSLFVI